MTMNQIYEAEKDMTYEQKVNKLNRVWQIRHQTEIINQVIPTCNKGVPKANFKEDGVIDPEKYFKSKGKILFLMEESNDIGENNEFWFQKLYLYSAGHYLKNKLKPQEKRVFTKYLNRFYEMYRIIDKQMSILNQEQKIKWIGNCAYMNLNKRGGGNTADLGIIRNYIAYYHEEIKQEIEIIDPTLITFCCKDFNPTKSNDVLELKRRLKRWREF